MLDHIGISVTDFAHSKACYEKALAPLSIALIEEISPAQTGANAHAGFGSDGKPFFWIGTGIRAAAICCRGIFRAAMDAGGTDNGSPGPRPH